MNILKKILLFLFGVISGVAINRVFGLFIGIVMGLLGIPFPSRLIPSLILIFFVSLITLILILKFWRRNKPFAMGLLISYILGWLVSVSKLVS